MSPSPKKVSRQANMVATLLGNSLAMMVKVAVRKHEFPMASMMRMMKLRVMNQVWSWNRRRERAL